MRGRTRRPGWLTPRLVGRLAAEDGADADRRELAKWQRVIPIMNEILKARASLRSPRTREASGEAPLAICEPASGARRGCCRRARRGCGLWLGCAAPAAAGRGEPSRRLDASPAGWRPGGSGRSWVSAAEGNAYPARRQRTLPRCCPRLQRDRDYQVTVANDLDVWLKGLAGRRGVTVVQFPNADHLFLDGARPPTPLDYQKPTHVDPKVIVTIAAWVDTVKTLDFTRLWV